MLHAEETAADAAQRAVSAAFLEYDSGSKGYLTRHELRCTHLAVLGWNPSKARARRVVLAASALLQWGWREPRLVRSQFELDNLLPKPSDGA